LSGKGLDPVQQSQPSSTVAQGIVIGTNPGPGQQVTVGSEVTIFVSTGPATAAMPDLKGDTQAKAASTLGGQGLKANFITTTVTSASQNGLVQSTTPAAGTPVTAGQTVAVVIGSYNAPTTTTTTTTTVPASTTTTTTVATSGAGGAQGATGQDATGKPSQAP
jgi:serine/threonine-protein kinase